VSGQHPSFFFRLRADNDKRNAAALLYCPHLGPLADITSSTEDMLYIDEKRFRLGTLVQGLLHVHLFLSNIQLI
jgi:hypothetical protein